jgi:hypothetical protein
MEMLAAAGKKWQGSSSVKAKDKYPGALKIM